LRGDSRILHDAPQPGAETLAQAEEPLVRGGPPQLAQRGAARRGGDRVAADAGGEPDIARVTQAVFPDEIHDVGATRHRSDGIAAAQGLAERGQIRTNAVILLGATVGEPKARHRLVEDEDEAQVARHLAQPLEGSGWGCRAAGTRLDDDPGELMARRLEVGGGGPEIVVGRDEYVDRRPGPQAGRG